MGDQPPYIPVPNSQVSISIPQRRVKLYQLFEPELDGAFSASTRLSLHATFLGIALGGLITILVALATSDSKDPNKHYFLIAGLVASLILGLCFSVFTLLAWLDLRAQKKRIKAEAEVRVPD
jgi:hypothetical protein